MVVETHEPNIITLFGSVTLLCGTDIILQNTFYIQIQCGDCSTEYCRSLMDLNNVMKVLSNGIK